MPLRYLSNFWRSLETSWINCKVELKLRWPKHCVLSVAGTDNANGNNDDVIFTIKNTKLYGPVVSWSTRYNQNQNFLAKNLKDQFIRMGIKQKVGIKIEQINTDIFSNQTNWSQ